MKTQKDSPQFKPKNRSRVRGNRFILGGYFILWQDQSNTE